MSASVAAKNRRVAALRVEQARPAGVVYALAIGDEHSHGPTASTIREALCLAFVHAVSDGVGVTVLRVNEGAPFIPLAVVSPPAASPPGGTYEH